MSSNRNNRLFPYIQLQPDVSCFNQQKEDISLSEGSTVDLRKPGEEEDEFSEMAEEAMDPENCFPDGKKTVWTPSLCSLEGFSVF